MARDLSDVVRDARAREEQAPERAPLHSLHLPTLADLRTGALDVTLSVRGVAIRATVDPDALSMRPMAAFGRLARNEGTESDLGELVRFIVAAILSWDLQESDDGRYPGGPVALTEERLSGFGVLLLAELAMALTGALRLGEANGTPLRQRSSRTTSSVRRGSSRR